MKKTASILLIILLLTQSVSAAFTDVTAESVEHTAIASVSQLGIMTGYEDNTFRSEEKVTRAQFAKIVTVVSGGEENAVLRMDAGQFADVTYNHWASGYISYAVANGILMGYGDGSFRPEQNITYAEALTVILRAMGYSAEDVGYYWPAGYIEKAYALGLISDYSFDPYAPISRGEIAILIDKALYMEGKGGAKLITAFDMKEYEDAVIIATKKTDSSLAGDQVSTSVGVFKKGSLTEVDEYIGIKADIVVDKNNNLVQILPAEQTVERAVIEGAVGKDITVSVNGRTKTIQLDDNMVVYYKGSKSSAAQQKANLTEGNELYMYSTGREVDYIFLYAYDIMGPYTVASGGAELINYFGIEDSSKVSVIRDGLSSSFAQAERYDVAYYAAGSNTLYLYCDKVSGTYDEAYPMKANVTEVTVSGRTYELEGSLAKSKLGEGAGAFKIGDKVTLLLGRDGLVADAVVLGEDDPSNYGVIISTRMTVSDDNDTRGQSEYYTTILKGDGMEVEQKSVKDYSDYKGRFVSIDYEDGKMKLTTVTYTPVYGALDKAAPSLGGVQFARNYKIIELVKQEGNSTPVVQCVELSDIKLKSLTKNQVIHAQTSNDFGDITVLYINNVTNSNYQYGILTHAAMSGMGMSISGSYTVMKDGVETDYRTSGVAYSASAGQAVGIETNGGALTGIKILSPLISSSKVEAVSVGRIKVDGEIYELDDNVQIFKEKDRLNTFTQISINDLAGMKDGYVTLYSDKPAGIIRVIKVQ